MDVEFQTAGWPETPGGKGSNGKIKTKRRRLRFHLSDRSRGMAGVPSLRRAAQNAALIRFLIRHGAVKQSGVAAARIASVPARRDRCRAMSMALEPGAGLMSESRHRQRGAAVAADDRQPSSLPA
ncbi:hypothetical protein [Burkholderia plantarii]|uniref:hypothetical protein n=1 Tax=Burkholderia plantarii TaxID=41899 RepID=UPI0018DDDA1C|nr:hypothetical protein [Burkholderia plantarii]MBI0329175.1 hypothetical protein [Burkholderia plantarii]